MVVTSKESPTRESITAQIEQQKVVLAGILEEVKGYHRGVVPDVMMTLVPLMQKQLKVIEDTLVLMDNG